MKQEKYTAQKNNMLLDRWRKWGERRWDNTTNQ